MLLVVTVGGTTMSHGAYVERMGMIESTDHGATWTFKGHAQFHAPALNPVDPSAILDNGLLVFYFFDLQSLATDTAVVYRSVATDATGLDFLPPAVAFKYAGDLTDPFVLKLPGGPYRMYVNGTSAILSATSNDGFTFTLDSGERTRTGGVPGAIVLPGDSIRLFVCGRGITSLISQNGLDFTDESGVRIPIPLGGNVAADPSPIRCNDGVYRMAYKVRPAGQAGPEFDEVHLAQSSDGLTWTPGPTSLVIGSVPTLVELPDGRLRIYYVDFQPDQPAGLFKFVKKTQVTPDANFLIAGFVRVGYVPARDRLAVTFGSKFAQPVEGKLTGHAYKEYALDMQPTGQFGVLNNEGGDCNGLVIGSAYYDVSMHNQADTIGWRISRFDVNNWTKTADLFFPVDFPRELEGDMMIAYVNGEIDLSSQYTTYGGPPPPDSGASTHHEFFSPDLQFRGKRILSDVPHILGSSLMFVDSIYYFVTATAYTGNLIVMEYDRNWHYLGTIPLVKEAHWSEGLTYDGQRFYVAYLSTSHRTVPGFWPYYPNVHLAAFDRNWTLLADVAVTNFAPADSLFTGRPSLLQHGNSLYVSYDVVPLPEDLDKIEGFVSVYEIASTVSAIPSGGRVALDFRLEQNYPNPFNPSTTIRYELPMSSMVRLSVSDILGRKVSVLVNERKDAGVHEVRFDGSNLASGVYFYRLQAGDVVQTKRLLLLR